VAVGAIGRGPWRSAVPTHGGCTLFAVYRCNNLNGILYEVQVFGGVLVGDELTVARAYFASSHGLPA
jgi:hypothetical protein